MDATQTGVQLGFPEEPTDPEAHPMALKGPTAGSITGDAII